MCNRLLTRLLSDEGLIRAGFGEEQQVFGAVTLWEQDGEKRDAVGQDPNANKIMEWLLYARN